MLSSLDMNRGMVGARPALGSLQHHLQQRVFSADHRKSDYSVWCRRRSRGRRCECRRLKIQTSSLISHSTSGVNVGEMNFLRKERRVRPADHRVTTFRCRSIRFIRRRQVESCFRLRQISIVARRDVILSARVILQRFVHYLESV